MDTKRKIIKKTLLSMFTLLTVAILYGQERKTLVVAPVFGKSINNEIKSMIHDALEKGICKSGNFKLADQGASLKQALDELEFQQNNVAPDDKQLIKFGHAAGANTVCFAEVKKLTESLFSIACKLIDVESSEILNIISKLVHNDTDNLPETATKISEELFVKESSEKPAAVSDENIPKPEKEEKPGKESFEKPAAVSDENTPKPEEEIKVKNLNLDSIEMIYVEGYGKVKSFYIGKYEITQAQWKAVMKNNPSYWKGDNLPVEQVSWNDVQGFINELNARTGQDYRLPTENEWKFAARGGIVDSFCPEGCKYSGSNNLDNVAWYIDNSERKSHPVGTKSANELGIYDMTGNVREWCQDCSDDLCTAYVSRGGSWGSTAENCLVAYRYTGNADDIDVFLGFRLACSSR